MRHLIEDGAEFKDDFDVKDVVGIPDIVEVDLFGVLWSNSPGFWKQYAPQAYADIEQLWETDVPFKIVCRPSHQTEPNSMDVEVMVGDGLYKHYAKAEAWYTWNIEELARDIYGEPQGDEEQLVFEEIGCEIAEWMASQGFREDGTRRLVRNMAVDGLDYLLKTVDKLEYDLINDEDRVQGEYTVFVENLKIERGLNEALEDDPEDQGDKGCLLQY